MFKHCGLYKFCNRLNKTYIRLRLQWILLLLLVSIVEHISLAFEQFYFENFRQYHSINLTNVGFQILQYLANFSVDTIFNVALHKNSNSIKKHDVFLQMRTAKIWNYMPSSSQHLVTKSKVLGFVSNGLSTFIFE